MKAKQQTAQPWTKERDSIGHVELTTQNFFSWKASWSFHWIEDYSQVSVKDRNTMGVNSEKCVIGNFIIMWIRPYPDLASRASLEGIVVYVEMICWWCGRKELGIQKPQFRNAGSRVFCFGVQRFEGEAWAFCEHKARLLGDKRYSIR